MTVTPFPRELERKQNQEVEEEVCGLALLTSIGLRTPSGIEPSH